ncbi:hypothetical protein H4R99_002456 [Coemansia sp. RSA 1722]|nr:hypothetical protein LPJ57_001762 [Coemansia sp. RSA 486]KAJ2603110.1 hypothetical protein H4R99_002456 [Coemansia sp. RSA 1722]
MAVSQESPGHDVKESSSGEPKTQRAKTFSSIRPATSQVATMAHSLRRTLTASLSSLIPSKSQEPTEPPTDTTKEFEAPGPLQTMSIEGDSMLEPRTVPIRITRSDTCRSAEKIAVSLESLGGKHPANVPSPLVCGFSPQSTPSTDAATATSSEKVLSADSSVSPASVTTSDSDRQQSAPRSFLNMLNLASLLNKSGQASPKSPTATFSLFARAASPPSDGLKEKVRATVAEYMEMTDRQMQGFIDCSTLRRRLGVGPRKLEKRELYYEVFGTGPKKLFLIMGMIGSTMYWRLQTRYFSDLGDYTICVFDNCGSGKSTIAPGPYRISQLAKDAYRVLDHLGWTENIHVVGISLGGMIAQEMCLQNTNDGIVPRFASVAFVDTWHSAALAMPTAKEVTFAFKGMSAFGTNPKHLIDLVFSREWIGSPFHDAVKEENRRKAAADGASYDKTPEPDTQLLTNKQVMLALFQAVDAELGMFRTNAGGSPRVKTPQSSPGLDDSTVEPTPEPPSLISKILQDNQPPIHHSLSAMQMRKSPTPGKSPLQPAATTPMPTTTTRRREVSGDLHQFMACLGHRLSAQRVRQIRQLNKKTRFLVIHGEKDRVIRPICGRTLAKLLECPIVWIKKAGHMPPIDAHCTFNLVIRAFTANEEWLRKLPDRINIVPAPWDDQVKVRQWIFNNHGGSVDLSRDNNRLSFSVSPPPPPPPPEHVDNQMENRGRRDSKLFHLHLSGPLDHELLIVDESHAELAGRIIPPNSSPIVDDSPRDTPSLSPNAQGSQRKLLLYGALVDVPFRIRRYDSL